MGDVEKRDTFFDCEQNVKPFKITESFDVSVRVVPERHRLEYHIIFLEVEGDVTADRREVSSNMLSTECRSGITSCRRGSKTVRRHRNSSWTRHKQGQFAVGRMKDIRPLATSGPLGTCSTCSQKHGVRSDES